jgi:hypothetical protein
VNPKAPLDKICLLGCGVATGERNLHFSLCWWVHTMAFCWCAWSLQITLSVSQISFLWSSLWS